MAWPAVPGSAAAAVLGILDQLGQTQWWPPELIRQYQFRQLGSLLNHAARNVPFYGARLAAAGFRPGDTLNEATWRRIPVLSRRDVQDNGRSLDSAAVPREHGTAGLISTSGSTGTPISVRRSQLSYLFWQAITLRDHLWHDRDVTAKLAMIRFDPEGHAKPPHGLEMPNWGEPTARFYPTGPTAMLAIASPIDVQIEWLRRHDPAYLQTHPTNLFHLARHCIAHGISLALRGVSTVGEALTPEARAACREAFGAEVTDIYSTREVGYVALQCPGGPHYHVQAEDVFVEILDDAGAPCLPGQIGRVVVTPLHNLATPLIRYHLGDHAEAGAPCPCGRGLPVIARIVGRTRNMLRLRTGQLLYPGYVVSKLVEVPAVIQFQAVQRTIDRIELRLVVRQPLTAEDEAAIRRIVSSSIGADFAVDIATCNAIERSASGKYEEFRSELLE
ncbi:MAG: phenylacetate--CoA ligase family protein [Alphaproteobacteria bacterium]|nr:phenylacetate--CoA ligase family protein [Alphaproteobacteria bacterium]